MNKYKVWVTIMGSSVRSLNRKYHCEDGPAAKWRDGETCWYLHGSLHREGGPAIENTDEHKEWWVNGLLHREDGPAIEFCNQDREWYLEGKELTEKEYMLQKKHRVSVNKWGRKEWRVGHHLHRKDGPAVERGDGSKSWYLDGLYMSKEKHHAMMAGGICSYGV